MSTIAIKNAYMSYDQTVLFDQLNLSIQPKRITCLLGPSGVGKSTLLRLIAGLITENATFSGTISCDENLSIAYMAQTDLLLPWLNALDNALLGFRLRGELSAAKIALAMHLFEKVDLKYQEKKFPHELSGGMRQRVALVRTLLEDKPVVLMDEPFSAVDAITRFELQNLAAELLKNKTVLLVTHDPMEALRIADTIFVMAGNPAALTTQLLLTSSTPRNLDDKDVIQNQEILFEALLKAKRNP